MDKYPGSCACSNCGNMIEVRLRERVVCPSCGFDYGLPIQMQNGQVDLTSMLVTETLEKSVRLELEMAETAKVVQASGNEESSRYIKRALVYQSIISKALRVYLIEESELLTNLFEVANMGAQLNMDLARMGK